jgi:alpha-amylase/alpha-mannosidase (GH57 family)
MTTRYVCVHGHFYQPPRENPWLEAIELQDSAYPYHDWNERITAECYAPNAASRILDAQQKIARMVNNYGIISFNFGPTLLSWLEAKSPQTLASIREADVRSAEKFGGHGSAMAQAYNHMIMPLANRRDQSTQVKWGLADFRYRFGRQAEGMWLPETAVDTETLEVLAENGVQFTVLAPRQASRVRRIKSRSWKDVTGDRVDPSRAYLIRLPSKKRIGVFFYDGPISRSVAFEGLLNDGKVFANRLLGGFSDARDWPQLSHIATDGESYGHHHRYGEMALTYALQYIEENQLARLTNYGQFLAEHPPTHLAEIIPGSSWSCAHGIERWRSDCGCNSGGHPGWNQEWRGPLRAALDWLRDSLAPAFEEKARGLFTDPWKARDEYIQVVLDRSPEQREKFFAACANHALTGEEKITALKLMELQRHAMLMYTSCGWFFDDISGLETVQVIFYASRALHLAQELFKGQWEQDFSERLALARSNLPEHADGKRIYDKWVRPAEVDIPKVAAHYAVSSLFENYPQNARIFCFRVARESGHTEQKLIEGKHMRLAVGDATIRSEITLECARINYAVLHLGEHHIVAGVRPPPQTQHDADFLRHLLFEAFGKFDIEKVKRLLQDGFGPELYSLRSLFRDAQRNILRPILHATSQQAAVTYRHIYESHTEMIRFLDGLGVPVPKAIQSAAEVVLNIQLRDALSAPELNSEHIRKLLQEASAMRVGFDVPTLEYAIRKKIEQAVAGYVADRAQIASAEKVQRLLDLGKLLPFPINLWQSQTTIYNPLIQSEREWHAQAGGENPDAGRWLGLLRSLREGLGFQTLA